jgi:hypothetical protein
MQKQAWITAVIVYIIFFVIGILNLLLITEEQLAQMYVDPAVNITISQFKFFGSFGIIFYAALLIYLLSQKKLFFENNG